jgi:hypothetical protein
VENEEELGSFITNNYKSLFMSSAGPENDELLQHILYSITDDMNEMLCAPCTGEDVKQALDSIGDLKAPSLDGMPAIFYKKFWHVVGPKV